MSSSLLVNVSVDSSVPVLVIAQYLANILPGTPLTVGANDWGGLLNGANISIHMDTRASDEQLRDLVAHAVEKKWPGALKGIWVYGLEGECESWDSGDEIPEVDRDLGANIDHPGSVRVTNLDFGRF